MHIQIFDTQAELDASAANLLIDTVISKPNAVLGLATGSTPIGIYAKMVEMYRKGEVSFSGVTTFNLDEYVGLKPYNDQSYAYYMNKHLFAHIDIPDTQTFLPNGMAEDLDAECVNYDKMQVLKQIDVQLLGLGHNGHIGFNEPDHALSGGTHVVKLKEATREANARFFATMDEVPEYAITMGVGSILKANSILLVVRGADKAEIVKQALTGPITTEVPASLLQTHPRVTVLLDREAGRMLD
ncbi:glucosamine-6-phosphate deaminase [Paenibacillus glycanilyticus]|uniref:Glucosamine-6-phosphate deaminase n=1 Tax=Paenibacillus glycanilyticus TaxID=126569 RepID=A0ABQ6GF27_9BACL|nr:glucosamine-6-phosphate deaminase [Paenibacillus glycanilyticus]GLX69574.1 glucosamine-6-phosphate deaminase 1 [Paenibacillus glycanilyticus]